MSKFIGAIVGVALVVAGVITGNPALIISGGSMILSNAVTVLAPSAKGQARQAQEMNLQLGEQPRSALFGEVATPGSLVDGFNYGGKYGTDWEVLVIRLADHKSHSLTGFYVNDQYVVFAGDGTVAGYNGQLAVYFRNDTTSDALPAVLTTNGPGWTVNDIGAGGTDVIVAYKADDPEAKNPVWPGGRPSFLWVVKGKLCYDSRLDDTVTGGAGDHRWDDPATWEWSDNPIVCRYNWVRGVFANDAVGDPDMLLVGRGLNEAEAPPENVFAPANLCDELVGAEKRYRVDGPVYANQNHLEVEEMFQAACGGVLVTREGSVEIEPGQAKSVVASFTDDDILVASSVEWNNGFLSAADNEWVNTVVARYVEPTQKWADHGAPVRRDVADVLADGKPREATVALRLVKRAAQAGTVAEIGRRLGRIWGRGSVTLGPRFCELEEGDWVNWTSARRFGGGTKTFRVEAYRLDEKWHNRLTLRQLNSTVFSDGAFDPDLAEANPAGSPPAIGAPESGSWTLTAGLTQADPGVGAAIPILVIAGEVEDPKARQVRFEYWRDDGATEPEDVADWTFAGAAGAGVTRFEIAAVVPQASYYAAVSYVVDGIPGDRLILGPVMAGTIVSGGSFVQPDPPAASESLPGTIWLDSDDGYRAYRRVEGSGLLSINGDRITIAGNAIELAWTEVPDQRLNEAIDVATVALANANQALDALADLNDDLILTVDEKIRILIPKAAQLETAWASLDAIADSLGITTERAAAAAARDDWLALLAGIAPAWNDISINSPLDRPDYDQILEDYGQALDALRIVISQAQETVVGLLTNENHTLPADAAGNVASYTGAGGSFRVFAGTSDVSASFALSTQANPQALTVGYVGQDYSITAGLDAGEDAATLTIRATGSGTYAGVTIDKVFSLGKSKTGATGGTGSPGANAKLLSVISDRQAIYYNTAGAADPSTQTTTFSANKVNTTATVTWSVTDIAGNPMTPTTTYLSAATGDSVTMTEGQFAAARNGTTGVIITGTLTDGVTLVDKISVIRVQQGATGGTGPSGAAGYSVAPPSAAFNIAATSNGTVKSGELPKTITFLVLQGATDLSDDADTDYSVSNSGCTSAMGGTNGKVWTLTAISADTAEATVTIQRSAVTIATVKISLVKARAGFASIALSDDTLTINNTGAYSGTQGGPIQMTVGPDGTVFLDANLPYETTGTNSKLTARVGYRTTPGSGAYTYLGADEVDAIGAQVGEPSLLSISRSVAGPAVATNWEFVFENYRHAGTSTLTVDGSGDIFTASWGGS